MKIVVTGKERAYLLASIIPPESWECNKVTFTAGPIRGGLETFIFELPGMHRDVAVNLIKQVLEAHPPSPENTWYPNKAAKNIKGPPKPAPIDWDAIDADHTARGV